MPQYLIELYTPTAAWRALNAVQRAEFLEGIQAAMGGLSELGIEVLTLSATDAAIDRASTHGFMGIWRFPDASARDALLAGIQASGWYGYFDHVNAAGSAGDLGSHLAALASA